ncbi:MULTISPECIES: hypothetical protein [Neisseria]|uniref:Uncharacterized protein n=1 Tax=Neisseria cinerea TaxID=483 RepID=A0A7T3BMM2_NEICI|nr:MULTISPECIES: hypothetical protein [Neisseria]MBD0764598.1 hypothetical protein [Neisseria sp. RH3002v2f]QPT38486.1 hypothetical protein I6G28_02750 [Neisseria cinerea]SQF83693.1 Uncharacterised protein [Neisseria cinerea]
MTNRPLLNETMHNGSRLFLQLPQTCPPSSLLRKIVHFGGMLTDFVSDWVTGETWIDFGYKGWKFGIHNPYDEYCFFAENNECPEAILQSMIQAV